MILSDRLATNYARYRVRFLFGPKGRYEGDVLTQVDVGGRKFDGQAKGTRPQFLRQLSLDASDPGAYVTSTVFTYASGTEETPGELDTTDITGLEHGDNVLYSSWSFLTFICEYVITLDIAALQTALHIYQSFQRLGDYEPGLAEPARSSRPLNEFWGYLLRADDIDDADHKQRIQFWLSDPTASSDLEPSPDQYTSLLCNSSIALRILREAESSDPEFPQSQAHRDLRDQLRVLIEERVRNCHHYIAQSCRYLLRREDGAAAGRGGWCWQFAYEFSKIAADVLDGDRSKFKDHFEPFLLEMLPDIIQAFITAPLSNYANKNAQNLGSMIVAQLPDAIFGKYAAGLRQSKMSALTATIPIIDVTVDLWSFLNDKGFDLLETDVDGEILQKIKDWLDAKIVGPLESDIENALQALIAVGDALDKEASLIISKYLFRLVASLVFHRPFPVIKSGFLEGGQNGTFFKDLGLFDPSTFETTITFPAIDIPIKTKAFKIKIAGIEKDIGGIDWGDFKLDSTEIASFDWSVLLDLITIPFQVSAYFLLQEFFDFLKLTLTEYNNLFHQNVDTDKNPFDSDFMPFGYFLLMATNGSFVEHGFDQMAVARDRVNCLFMALNHRLFGLSGSDFDDVMRELDRAPDTFPNGHDPNLWDKDFRWLRNSIRSDAPSDQLYSGLDFLCAVVLAATADAPANRQKVRDAIENAIAADLDLESLESPTSVNLPFLGPVAGPVQIGQGLDGVVGSAAGYCVSVVFANPGVPGKLKIRFGASTTIEFLQSEPSRSVVVPTMPEGIVIEFIDVGVAGVISVEAVE